MRHAVWFVRLVFGAWLVPAGINHFFQIFPQPMGNQPLSQALIAALIDSGLFDLVKAVELIAGLCLLLGFHVPLALVALMPVSFCVWYWDVPLQGWDSVSAYYGWAVLGCNVLLCLAYIGSYKRMFSLRAEAIMPGLARMARLVFGGWMLVNGANQLALHLYAMPAGQTPLAVQLMSALSDSGLLAVAMAVQMVAGALILAGLFAPAALCVTMPITVCAAYWAVILDREPLGAILALAALALNGLLMLAHVGGYRDLLRRRVLAWGESAQETYESRYTDPRWPTSRGAFIGALIPLIAAYAFYYLLLPPSLGMGAMMTLLFPAFMLHARRLRDMERPAWLLAAPGALILAAIALRIMGAPTAEGVMLGAIAFMAAFTLWGVVAGGKGGGVRGRVARA